MPGEKPVAVMGLAGGGTSLRGFLRVGDACLARVTRRGHPKKNFELAFIVQSRPRTIGGIGQSRNIATARRSSASPVVMLPPVAAIAAIAAMIRSLTG